MLGVRGGGAREAYNAHDAWDVQHFRGKQIDLMDQCCPMTTFYCYAILYTATCCDQMLIYTELCRCIGRSFNDRSHTLSTVPDLSILTVEEVQHFIADGLCGLPPLCARALGVGVVEQLNSAHELFALHHEAIADAHALPLDTSSGSNTNESVPADFYSHIDIYSGVADQLHFTPIKWVGDVTVNEIATVVRQLVEKMVPGDNNRCSTSIDCLSFQAIQKCLSHRSDTGHTTHPIALRSSPEAHSKYCTVVCCEAARTLFYEAQVVIYSITVTD